MLPASQQHSTPELSFLNSSPNISPSNILKILPILRTVILEYFPHRYLSWFLFKTHLPSSKYFFLRHSFSNILLWYFDLKHFSFKQQSSYISSSKILQTFLPQTFILIHFSSNIFFPKYSFLKHTFQALLYSAKQLFFKHFALENFSFKHFDGGKFLSWTFYLPRNISLSDIHLKTFLPQT